MIVKEKYIGFEVMFAYEKKFFLLYSVGNILSFNCCGNINLILDDYIEMGIDAMNPLEAKADLDSVLRKEYGQSLGICGNSNIQVWETGDKELIREEVLRKLNAAKGDRYIFQSDHSVASDVSGQTYDYIVKLVCKYGQYPLKLGEHDIYELSLLANKADSRRPAKLQKKRIIEIESSTKTGSRAIL